MASETHGAVWSAKLLAAILVCFSLGASAQDAISIVGSGSNLPLALYQAWVNAYNQRTPNVRVRYLPMGTVVSIEQISKGSGDFGGGEVPLSSFPLGHSARRLVSVPVALVAVVPVYNLPSLNQELRFSGKLLADIYLGKVRTWDDPEIAKLNPGVKLPSLPIEIFHRAPGKGTNYILSDFLSKENATFRQQIGRSASPKWPLGASTMRNQDMVAAVKGTPGAIGYVELNYRTSGVSVGRVENPAGKFVEASRESVRNACDAVIRAGVRSMEESLTDAPGENSYPISSFTYVYVPVNPTDHDRATAVKAFLQFALSDGQEIAETTNYAALPKPVLVKAVTKLRSIQ